MSGPPGEPGDDSLGSLVSLRNGGLKQESRKVRGEGKEQQIPGDGGGWAHRPVATD